MIWLSWRQLRVQAAVVYASLGILVVALAITGARLSGLSDTVGPGFVGQVTSADTVLYDLGFAVVLALPAIVGVFWGAPLVAREVEAGTHRLVWNQTITRTRWLATKAGLTGLVAIAAVALVSLMLTWWCGPIDTAIAAGNGGDGLLGVPRISPLMFGARGIAPIGYAAFALALGVAAGIVMRRTVPAMAVTLAVFVIVQVALPTLVRPNLGPSEQTTPITAHNFKGVALASAPAPGPVRAASVKIDRPGDWITSSQTVDATGRVADSLPAWFAECAPKPEGPRGGEPSCFSRLAEQGYRQRLTYQPASRYWTLQAYETAIFFVLAALLLAVSFWWLRRR